MICRLFEQFISVECNFGRYCSLYQKETVAVSKSICFQRFLITGFILIFLIGAAKSQSLSGYVLNEDDEPIPYVNIFVRQLGSGTTTDEKGYYYLTMDPGEYDIVLSSIGYETKNALVKVDLNDTANFALSSSDYELEEVTIKASKKDPAYEIIRYVIDNKKKYQSQIETYRCEIYVKALEEIDIKEKEKSDRALAKEEQQKKAREEKEAKKKKREENQGVAGIDKDPFDEAEAAKAKEMAKLNLLEMQLTLNFQAPENYKEERTAYKVYGSKHGLYVPRFDDADFDFYDNMVQMREITETPIVSPVSRTAILSYKYKLIASTKENGQLVHKIRVTPRKSGNSTVKGHIYINDELWNINRVDFDMPKGSMKLFDELNINLVYEEIQSNIWLPTEQVLTYSTKIGKKKQYDGTTVLSYSDIELNYNFPEKFFGAEVSSITQEAYDRDSTFWNESRPVELTKKEQKLVFYKDSLEAIYNSKEYKDSIQAAFNKVELIELFWQGMGFRNHERKESFFITSVPQLINFDIVGGFRFGPWASYFRRYENGKTYRTSNNFSIGERNGDLTGRTYHNFMYDPFHLAEVNIVADRSFRTINPNDAILNYFRSSNYYLRNNIGIGHRREFINGLYLFTGADWSHRGDISHLDRFTGIEELFEEEEPIEFESYNTFISRIELSFTPFQKYSREPNRKIILGSKWPTFSLLHRKGWEGVFDSEVNFDYLEFEVYQDLILGVFGNSKYRFLVGDFVNTKQLPFLDIKRFRQSDPFIYLEPLENFQVLDTNLVTSSPFIEFHYIHHFNGALVNNIPLIKKTRIGVVAGGGFLYESENNYRHQELFAGLERVFKLGPRRRMRLGVYGVIGESNFTPIQTDYKFSIDIIDTWKRDWSF